jgi:hypothetical protein
LKIDGMTIVFALSVFVVLMMLFSFTKPVETRLPYYVTLAWVLSLVITVLFEFLFANTMLGLLVVAALVVVYWAAISL